MNAKQLIKFIAIFTFTYCMCHVTIYISNWPIQDFIDQITSTSIIITPAISAMSFAMFTYTDNIAKDLIDLRNEVARSKYLAAQEKFSKLKTEILLNVVFIIGLFVMERFIKSAMPAAISFTHKNPWLATTIFLSIRFSLFSILIWTTLSQILGYLTTVEYRAIIASNRK